MYLVELELTNVRAIRQMTVDFRSHSGGKLNRRWTVLLGENGCGKSTILKSIGLLLAGSEALPDLIGNPDQWIRNSAEFAEIKAIISTAEGQTRNIKLRINRGDSRDIVIRSNSKQLTELDAAIRHADRNFFIAGYGAFRRPPDESGKRYHGRAQGRAPQLATLYSQTSELVSLEQWAMDLDYSEGPDARSIIENALKKLLPGMTFKGIDKRNRALIMSTVDGDVPLHQLSEGYQAMAAWAGDLLFRMTETFKDRKNPLEARGVLLIDEMDIHLHPVWKRNLVDFLNSAFPNMQIIATTHSPLSIQQCGEGELYVVKRDKSGPTLLAFKGDPSKLRLSELFLSPLIGLDTLDSPKTAALREEAKQIELKPGKKSRADLNQLETLQQQLIGTSSLPVAEAPAFAELISEQQRKRPSSAAQLVAKTAELFGTTRGTIMPSTAKKSTLVSLVSELEQRLSTNPSGNATIVVRKAAAKKATPKKAIPKKTAVKKATAKNAAPKKTKTPAVKKAAAKKTMKVKARK